MASGSNFATCACVSYKLASSTNVENVKTRSLMSHLEHHLGAHFVKVFIGVSIVYEFFIPVSILETVCL